MNTDARSAEEDLAFLRALVERSDGTAAAWAELQHHSFATWLIYPACVFILQGAAWMVAWAVRRQAWLGLVAVGWFAFAIAMGLTTDHLGFYVLFCGLGIWSCMALPGWLL